MLGNGWRKWTILQNLDVHPAAKQDLFPYLDNLFWSYILLGTNIKKLRKKRLNFFKISKKKSAYKEPEQLDSSSSSSTSKQLAIYGKINISEVTYAEIRWVLKIIAIGFSMNSVDDVCDTFKKVSREWHSYVN